jgi:hypothetical protein
MRGAKNFLLGFFVLRHVFFCVVVALSTLLVIAGTVAEQNLLVTLLCALVGIASGVFASLHLLWPPRERDHGVTALVALGMCMALAVVIWGSSGLLPLELSLMKLSLVLCVLLLNYEAEWLVILADGNAKWKVHVEGEKIRVEFIKGPKEIEAFAEKVNRTLSDDGPMCVDRMRFHADGLSRDLVKVGHMIVDSVAECASSYGAELQETMTERQLMEMVDHCLDSGDMQGVERLHKRLLALQGQ